MHNFPLSNSAVFLSAGNCQVEISFEVGIEFNGIITEAITLDCIGEQSEQSIKWKLIMFKNH